MLCISLGVHFVNSCRELLVKARIAPDHGGHPWEDPGDPPEKGNDMKRSKRYKELLDKITAEPPFELDTAIGLVKETASAKFDESVEIAFRLGLDVKRSDQQVRGTVVLPHGTGRTVRILVLASGEKIKEAEQAGADFVGGEDYVAKIQGGWLDVDTIIATPDMMKNVGKLGKILGPRGLMPNPKTGTVTPDVAKAVSDAKAGKIEYRTDKTGNVHAAIGKASFDASQLRDNLVELAREVIRAKPAAAKGTYIRNVTISTTMGPGIDISSASIMDAVK
jgi:large subunit ribosomal protein L1